LARATDPPHPADTTRAPGASRTGRASTPLSSAPRGSSLTGPSGAGAARTDRWRDGSGGVAGG